MFKNFTPRQWGWLFAAFVAGIVLCTATLSYAQPPRADCTECATCLDELYRCEEKRDNIRQGVYFGLGVAAAGVAISAGGISAGLGSGVALFGVGWAGAAYVHLLLTKCTPCNSACVGCDMSMQSGYG